MRRLLRDNSLSLIFGLLFLAAVMGQSVAGWKEFNSHQLAEGLAQLSFRQYVSSADFAVDVSENWQSEYLPVPALHRADRLVPPEGLPRVEGIRH